MNGVLRIAAAAVAAALCAVVVKKQAPELGLVLALAAGAVILSFAAGALEQITDFLERLADTAGLSPAVLAPVLKVTGIALVSRTAAALCRDASESGVASFVETAAAALALVVSLPLLQSVLSMITQLI